MSKVIIRDPVVNLKVSSPSSSFNVRVSRPSNVYVKMTNFVMPAITFGDIAGIDETIQDEIGSTMTSSNDISFSYNDSLGQVSASLVDPVPSHNFTEPKLKKVLLQDATALEVYDSSGSILLFQLDASGNLGVKGMIYTL